MTMTGPTKSELPEDRQAPDADSPNAGMDVNEYVALPSDADPDFEVEDLPDGGQIVYLGQPDPRADHKPGEFYANLAEVLPDSIMQEVASDLLRLIEEDKEARKKRDEQYEEGIKRTGLGKDAPGGADFDGASRVVHPMLTEACIDYESRVIKELFPPSGPVKAKIIGEPTAEKTKRAARKVEHLNYQITFDIKEAFGVMETTLTQVPLGGVQYIKQWWDHRLGRPRWQFVPVDHVYLPFSSANFHSATRRTHAETITNVEYRQRVDSGQYRDVEIPPPSQLPEQSKSAKATAKVDGVDDDGMNLDGMREIYEVMAYIEITEDIAEALGGEEQVGKFAPYLISIDTSSAKVVSWYRDWEEGDVTFEPIEHLFEFPFIPWRGAYSIGFPQIIGGLSAAATGALRALLDSAHINNIASGVIKKGSGASGQTVQPVIGSLVEIDVGLEAQDIRQSVMAFPFNPPSTVLFQLLGFLVDAAKGTVRTSLDDTAINTNTNVPVGTQLSRVEEGLVVFSSIHGRIHRAFNRLLIGLHRLNSLYLPDEPLRVGGSGKEILVSRADYKGPCDIEPVSDPTIYSDQQRMAQISAVQQRAMVVPQIYNMRKVEERFLRLMKVSDPDELLIKQPEPHELNAINECLSMALGQPVVTFPEQDHLAHIQVHVDFMKSPVLGMSPLIAQQYIPVALRHIAEHIVMYYVAHTVDMVRDAAGQDPSELMSKDDEVKRHFDQLLAQASPSVIADVEKAIAGIMPVINQARQMLQSMQPQPQADPAVVLATQASMAETQRKTAADQASAQQAEADRQANLLIQQERNAIQSQRNENQLDIADQANATREAIANYDGQTARDIASARLTEGVRTGYTNGESIKSGV